MNVAKCGARRDVCLEAGNGRERCLDWLHGSKSGSDSSRRNYGQFCMLSEQRVSESCPASSDPDRRGGLRPEMSPSGRPGGMREPWKRGLASGPGESRVDGVCPGVPREERRGRSRPVQQEARRDGGTLFPDRCTWKALAIGFRGQEQAEFLKLAGIRLGQILLFVRHRPHSAGRVRQCSDGFAGRVKAPVPHVVDPRPSASARSGA